MSRPIVDNANKMVSPPSLDLLLLTFNCAKAPVDVPDFSAHLRQALHPAARTAASYVPALPDIVVFSLQEVAPIGRAFAGAYFLNPYLASFETVVNKASVPEAEAAWEAAGGESSSSRSSSSPDRAAGQANGTLVESSTPTGTSDTTAATASSKPHRPYRLVRQANVGMTVILLFARRPESIQNLQVAECGFGVADMGNKGAVGLRFAYRTPLDDRTAAPSELTFVATHLAPMEWNVGRRNANWRSIVGGLTFGNPQDVVSATAGSTAIAPVAAPGRGRQGRTHNEAASEPRTREEEAEAEAAEAAGDDTWLLLGQEGRPSEDGAGGSGSGSGGGPDVRRQLQDLSVFRRNNLLFVAGDLNYRTSAESPPPDADFPTTEETSWRPLLARDQLLQELRAGRTLHGLREAPIGFPPTYKYDVLDDANEDKATNRDELKRWKEQRLGSDDDEGSLLPPPPVPWKFAAHRWPSWCDRILYLDVPAWTRRHWQQLHGESSSSVAPAIQVEEYRSLPLMRTSDHQPVYLRARVPLLGAEWGEADEAEDSVGEVGGHGQVADRGERGELDNDDTVAVVDPRFRLPVPIDIHAWDRRAGARRRELLAGCTMLLFNTQLGAVVVATTVVAMVGAYWLWVGWLQ